MNGSHAFSAATARCFEQQRVANSRGRLSKGLKGRCFVVFFDLFAGNDGHAGGSHCLASGHFVAHLFDGFGRRPDPNEAGRLDRSSKVRSFREKAESRVDGRRTGG